jgi:hypothetical protein
MGGGAVGLIDSRHRDSSTRLINKKAQRNRPASNTLVGLEVDFPVDFLAAEGFLRFFLGLFAGVDLAVIAP